MSKTLERRFISQAVAPLRVESRADGGKTITGYAAVFYRPGDPGTEYRVFDDLVERILPGAFDQVLREGETVGLFNHNRNVVLGRRSAGTLRLSVDATGLRYEIDAPDRQDAKDLIVSLERHDVTGSSFSFLLGDNSRVVWVEEGNTTIRELHQVSAVPDVGPVTFPAYEGTTAAVRAVGELEPVKAERDAWRAVRRSASEAEALQLDLELDLRRQTLAGFGAGSFGRKPG